MPFAVVEGDDGVDNNPRASTCLVPDKVPIEGSSGIEALDVPIAMQISGLC